MLIRVCRLSEIRCIRKELYKRTLTLDNYKTFDNVADLNEAIRLHLREYQYKLNATSIKMLEVISRYAFKYPGVAKG